MLVYIKTHKSFSLFLNSSFPERQMNPDIYRNVLRYLSLGSYPQGATKSQRCVMRQRASNFVLDEGTLYYKKVKGQDRRKVVYDKEEAKQIFQEYHTCTFGRHSGIVKTRNAVRKRYYWPGMTNDINKWVGECLECQTGIFTVKVETDSIPTQWPMTNETSLKVEECMESQTDIVTVKLETDIQTNEVALKVEECMESQTDIFTVKLETDAIDTQESITNEASLKASKPFEFVEMAVIGRVTKTDTGNMYICVMMDYYSKWSEAFALSSKTPANVADCVMKFFYRFGAPQKILTYQGKDFVNKLNKHLCKRLGTQHSLCEPYNSQSNEPFESLNGTVQRLLRELVHQRPKSWDVCLDAMMFVLRTKKHNTTESSPFFLLFGKEARLPNEVPEHCRDGLMYT